MANLIHDLDPARVARNLKRVRSEIDVAAGCAGRDPTAVEICAAVKYVDVGDLGILADAGITLAGENRVQDLEAKVAAHGSGFTWDFIGHLQSRKVKRALAHVRLIHSVCSDSVLAQLDACALPGTEVLVEVNVAGDEAKDGVTPAALPGFLERCPVRVGGLMTMAPLTTDAEANRPYFRRLAQLADEHGLARLSMGTSQDYRVAVQEGATIVRIGTILYE